jgi:CheY-like chemotaxis protein
MPSVLVVDDNLSVQLTLEFCLQDAGYTVLLAGDGTTALKLASENPIDLMLLDVNMPGMSGLIVCQAFKSSPALRHIPVVMMTSCPTREVLARAAAIGAAEVMPKPFELPQLYAILSRNLPGEVKKRDNTDAASSRPTASEIPGPLGAKTLGFSG